jgi:hypothetical protein
MTITTLKSRILPAAMLGAIGLAAFVASGTAADATDPLPFTCGVSVANMIGSVSLTAFVEADEDMRATYELSIVKQGNGGSARINQGGAFEVEHGKRAILGQTVLGGAPGQYDIDFTLDWNGARFRCPTIDI